LRLAENFGLLAQLSRKSLSTRFFAIIDEWEQKAERIVGGRVSDRIFGEDLPRLIRFTKSGFQGTIDRLGGTQFRLMPSRISSPLCRNLIF
jgi:hypothetical protein